MSETTPEAMTIEQAIELLKQVLTDPEMAERLMAFSVVLQKNDQLERQLREEKAARQVAEQMATDMYQEMSSMNAVANALQNERTLVKQVFDREIQYRYAVAHGLEAAEREAVLHETDMLSNVQTELESQYEYFINPTSVMSVIHNLAEACSLLRRFQTALKNTTPPETQSRLDSVEVTFQQRVGVYWVNPTNLTLADFWQTQRFLRHIDSSYNKETTETS